MHIEIFFDFSCPWCFIGKHRLEQALAQRPRLVARLRWRPYQLNPAASRSVAAGERAGGRAGQTPRRNAHVGSAVREAAERDGIVIDLNQLQRFPSTLNAHRLLRLAAASGLDPAILVDRLFQAHFRDARDIGDKAELIRLGSACGLPADGIRSYLDSDRDVRMVLTADTAARRGGVHAIPCIVFERRFAISGAQDPGTYLPLLDLAAAGAPPRSGRHAGQHL